jgi:ADP-ribose pyrophosphatase YjhB (NUDIX family)
VNVYCQRCGGQTEQREIDGKLRPVCTSCGAVTYLDPKLAVAAIIERNGVILLGKRADWVRSPGRWTFPAGFVERGEVVERAVIREAFEETGLTIEVGPILGVFSEAGDATVLLAYPALGFSGTPHPGDDLIELAWHAPHALPELAFDHDLEIIRRWRDWRGSAISSRPDHVS